jgi:hypothetical protein
LLGSVNEIGVGIAISRVEDWRDAQEILWARFQSPASSNPSCRFPAMGLPASFVARVMRPIRSVGLSTGVRGDEADTG